jgi:hypothetical protein
VVQPPSEAMNGYRHQNQNNSHSNFNYNMGVRNGSGEEGRRYEMPKKYGDLKNYHQPLW